MDEFQFRLTCLTSRSRLRDQLKYLMVSHDLCQLDPVGLTVWRFQHPFSGQVH